MLEKFFLNSLNFSSLLHFLISYIKSDNNSILCMPRYLESILIGSSVRFFYFWPNELIGAKMK